MLKKTKLITIKIHIFNSTYTISWVIGVRPVLISIDHCSRAALDNMTGWGVFPISSISQLSFLQTMKMKYNFSGILYPVLGYWKWFAEINDSTPLNKGSLYVYSSQPLSLTIHLGNKLCLCVCLCVLLIFLVFHEVRVIC